MTYTIKRGDLWLQGFSEYGCIYASDERDAIRFKNIHIFDSALEPNSRIVVLKGESSNGLS